MSELITCLECRARIENGSYHPFLACLLIKSGWTVEAVIEHLNPVREHGRMESQETIKKLRLQIAAEIAASGKTAEGLGLHIKKMESVLKKIQWIDNGGLKMCPLCEAWKTDGHETGCRLAKHIGEKS